MPGPRPTPTRILEMGVSSLVGTRANEPRPELSRPSCPSWVSKSARRHWKWLSRELFDLGVLAETDRIGLGLLADALGQYIEAKKEVEKGGLVMTTAKGHELRHPAVGAMNKAWERVLKALREFGLTPASRIAKMLAHGQLRDPGA